MNAPAQANPSKTATIGRLLLNAGKITAEDTVRIGELQKNNNIRFGEAAIQLGLVTETDLLQALSVQFDYPYLVPAESGFSTELFTAYEPFSAQAERLRTLRSQLILRWFDGGGAKALAIVAAEPGEGVSHLAANLAVAFSQLRERTLLIDANLRDPRQHEIFSLGQCAGLTEVLSGRAPCDAVVTGIDALPHLSVLPAGAQPPNPVELLSRPAFALLLDEVFQNWSIVIVDTAPASAGADFQTVAIRCRGALLIARQNRSRVEDLAKLRDMIAAGGSTLIGSVVTQN